MYKLSKIYKRHRVINNTTYINLVNEIARLHNENLKLKNTLNKLKLGILDKELNLKNKKINDVIERFKNGRIF